jgi:hypothetical protein
MDEGTAKEFTSSREIFQWIRVALKLKHVETVLNVSLSHCNIQQFDKNSHEFHSATSMYCK